MKTLYLASFGVRYEYGHDRFTKLVWVGPDENIRDKIFDYYDSQYSSEITIVNLEYSEAIE